MHGEQERLQAFLTGRDEPPDTGTLRRYGLAGWTFGSRDRKQLGNAELRSDFLQSFHRHYQIRRELRPLLEAWHRAGVECLLFKGFWLSETVYPTPGMRFYGDVDILLHESQIKLARTVAVELGWIEQQPILAPTTYSHAAFNLLGPDGHTCLDVHRFLIHSSLPWYHAQQRITAAMWARSRARLWEDLHVRELDPVDAALVLVLQRSWGEGWQLKPADILDLRCLVQTRGIRREQLLARAFELNCSRTLRIFLERCDPWHRRIDLCPPTEEQLRRYQRAVGGERPLLSYERLFTISLNILRRGPGLCVDIAVAVPSVLRARRALRGHRPMSETLQEMTPADAPALPCAPQQYMRTIAGVRWAIRLLTPGQGNCLMRSLALYHALRAQGCPVTFVSGVRRRNGEVDGHAWLELDGHVPQALRETIVQDFTASFRYPEAENGMGVFPTTSRATSMSARTRAR